MSHQVYDEDGEILTDLDFAGGEDERREYSAYRCTDRMCGATDCSNCYPGAVASRDATESDGD